MDYPNVRTMNYCPICESDKDYGLIACWTCYRKYGLRYGMPPEVRVTLEYFEVNLKEQVC